MNANEMIARAEFLSLQYVDDRYQMATKLSGCTRTVRIEGQYAFKAVFNAKNANQNRAEWDFYTMTTDQVRAKLAKPLYISRNGNIIVMEALTPWYDRSDDDSCLSRHETEIEAITRETHGFTMGDIHGENWGVRASGVVVLLDYGWIEWRVRRYAHEKMDRKVRYATPEPDYVRDYMAEMLLTNTNN